MLRHRPRCAPPRPHAYPPIWCRAQPGASPARARRAGRSASQRVACRLT